MGYRRAWRVRHYASAACFSGSISGHNRGLLVDENVENALANIASMKMVLLPFLQFEPPECQIEEMAILNVRFRGNSKFRFPSRQSDDLVVDDWSPHRRDLRMVCTIREHRTRVDDNLCTTANAFINSGFLVSLAVQRHCP